ncbi:MAG: decaprenyl-phosphate phosphoribosyltransferase [Kiritimatiellae bacterium]|nr:decaprenyl-phosphate phosphoribosyltransferase [Kiritimatiellia bacterium]
MMRLLRLEHSIKNILVALPAFFLGVLFEQETFLSATIAFISFTLVSSAVYAVNDIFDREEDAKHPLKRLRPIASGAFGVKAAVILAAVLSAAGIAMSLFAHSPLWAFVAIAAYLAVNVAYSAGLKDVPLIDIFILASGFVFRIFYGGFFCGIQITSWMFLAVFSGALYFAAGKRRCELAKYGPEAGSRSVLRHYTKPFLAAHYYMFCALTILFYCLWTITRTDQKAVGKLAFTIPFLIFILARYNLLVETGRNEGDPVNVLLHDKWLVMGAIGFVAVNFVVLYFGAYLPRVTY